MKELQVTCPYCGYIMDAGGENAPASVTCPACGHVKRLRHESGAEPESAPRAQSRPTPQDRLCPVCGKKGPATTVICPHCGYDWRTGQVDNKYPAKTWLPRLVLPVIALSVFAAVLVIMFLRSGQPEAVPTEEKQAAAALSAPTAPPQSVADAQETAVAESIVATVGKAGMSTDDSPHTTAELTEIAKQYYRRLTLRLDKKYPPFVRGSRVALRRANGRMHRGIFLGIKDDVVVIADDHASEEIPLALLDQSTRIRCDNDYREKVIRARVKSFLKKITMQKNEKRNTL